MSEEIKIKEQQDFVTEETLNIPEIDYDEFRPIFNFENMSDDEIVDGALNRLTQDTYYSINGLPLISCFMYVYNKAKNDMDFAKKVLIKSKCFTKAFAYLKKEVQAMTQLQDKGVGLDHRQIFSILEDYYNLDDLEIAKKEAITKAKIEAQKKSNEKKSNKIPSKKSKPKSKTLEAKSADPSEINIFDLLGGSDE